MTGKFVTRWGLCVVCHFMFLSRTDTFTLLSITSHKLTHFQHSPWKTSENVHHYDDNEFQLFRVRRTSHSRMNNKSRHLHARMNKQQFDESAENDSGKGNEKLEVDDIENKDDVSSRDKAISALSQPSAAKAGSNDAAPAKATTSQLVKDKNQQSKQQQHQQQQQKSPLSQSSSTLLPPPAIPSDLIESNRTTPPRRVTTHMKHPKQRTYIHPHQSNRESGSISSTSDEKNPNKKKWKQERQQGRRPRRSWSKSVRKGQVNTQPLQQPKEQRQNAPSPSSQKSESQSNSNTYSSLLPPLLDSFRNDEKTSATDRYNNKNKNDKEDALANGLSSWEEFLGMKQGTAESLESVDSLFPRSTTNSNDKNNVGASSSSSSSSEATMSKINNINTSSVSDYNGILPRATKSDGVSSKQQEGEKEYVAASSPSSSSSRLPSITDLFPPDLTALNSTTSQQGVSTANSEPTITTRTSSFFSNSKDDNNTPNNSNNEGRGTVTTTINDSSSASPRATNAAVNTPTDNNAGQRRTQVQQQQHSLEGVLPVSDLFYRSSQAMDTIDHDDEELPFSAEQSDEISSDHNKIKIRRNQAATGSSSNIARVLNPNTSTDNSNTATGKSNNSNNAASGNTPSSSTWTKQVNTYSPSGNTAGGASGGSSGNRRKMVRRGMEMLVGGVPINADPPQRSVELWYDDVKLASSTVSDEDSSSSTTGNDTKEDWAKVITLNSRDFGPLLHATSVDFVSNQERGLYCEHFVYSTMKWDVCPKHFKTIVKKYYESVERQVRDEQVDAEKDQNHENPIASGASITEHEGIGSKNNENNDSDSDGKQNVLSMLEKTPFNDTSSIEAKPEEVKDDQKDQSNNENRMNIEVANSHDPKGRKGGRSAKGFGKKKQNVASGRKNKNEYGLHVGIVVSVGVSRDYLEYREDNDDNDDRLHILKDVLIRGVSTAVSKELEGFDVKVAKLELKEQDDGYTYIHAEFLFEARRMPLKDFKKRSTAMTSAICDALDDGQMQLALAAAAKVETRWPESMRDRIVEEFLFEDDKEVIEPQQGGETEVAEEKEDQSQRAKEENVHFKKHNKHIKSKITSAANTTNAVESSKTSSQNDIDVNSLLLQSSSSGSGKFDVADASSPRNLLLDSRGAVSEKLDIVDSSLLSSNDDDDDDDDDDGPFGNSGNSLYDKDDLYLGGGNDGVFYDHSVQNIANSPYKGELGPILLDATVERAKQRYPRVIAVGDVHGCIDELQELLRQCDYQPGDLVVFLGDLVSKGPDSISVVQMAREIGAIGVRGNHDFEVIRWHQAIKSGVDPPVIGSEHFHIASCLSKADMKWMYSLPWYISSKELGALFVHAGFVSGIRLAKQNPRLMMNMRSILPDGTVTSKFFNNWPWARLWDGPQTVLFGHDADRGLQQYEHAIGLDTGCVYGGRLTACILPEKRLVSVSARREYFKYRRKHYD